MSTIPPPPPLQKKNEDLKVLSKPPTPPPLLPTNIKKKKPLHTCYVCSKNDIENPHTEFRYCISCNSEICYCEDHINNHTHIH